MKGFNQIKYVELSGTPYERGHKHGSELKEWIYETVLRAEYSLTKYTGRDISEIYAQFYKSTSHLETSKKYVPHLIEEIRGVADGSGFDFDRIFALQCNEEIMMGMLASNKKYAVEEKCSSLGARKSPNSASFVGQNLDWVNFYEGFNVILHIKDEETGLESLVNTQPGLLALNGMNNAPLGICVNSLENDLNCSNSGLPLVFLIRLLLEQKSLPDAVNVLTTIPHAVAQNFAMGGIENVVNYECSSNKVAKFEPLGCEGRIFHTNHPLVNNDYRLPPFKFKGERTTFARFDFMAYRLKASNRFTIDSAKMLFRSYFGPICANNPGTHLGGMTLFSSIFELTSNPVLHITVGPPSRNEYQTYELPAQKQS